MPKSLENSRIVVSKTNVFSSPPLVKEATNTLQGRVQIPFFNNTLDQRQHSTYTNDTGLTPVVLFPSAPPLPRLLQRYQGGVQQQPALRERHINGGGGEPVLIFGTVNHPVTLADATVTGRLPDTNIDAKDVSWLVGIDFDRTALHRERQKSGQDTKLVKLLVYCLGQIIRLRAEEQAMGDVGDAALRPALLARIENILTLGFSIKPPVRIPEENICAPLLAVAAYLADVEALQLLLGHYSRISTLLLMTIDLTRDEWVFRDILVPVANAVRQTPLGEHREPKARLVQITDILVKRCLTLIKSGGGDETQLKKQTQKFLDLAMQLSLHQRNDLLLSAICKCDSPWRFNSKNDLIIAHFLATAQICWPEGIKIWLDYGVDIDVRRPNAYVFRQDLRSGYTALHYAAMQTDPSAYDKAVQVVDILLENGANPVILASEREDSDESLHAGTATSPFFLACMARNVEVARILAKAEAKLLHQNRFDYIAEVKRNITKLTGFQDQLSGAPPERVDILVRLISNIAFTWAMHLGHLRNYCWYEELQCLWINGVRYTNPEVVSAELSDPNAAQSTEDILAFFKQKLAQVTSAQWVEDAYRAPEARITSYKTTVNQPMKVAFRTYELTRMIRAEHFAAAEQFVQLALNSSHFEHYHAALLCLTILSPTGQFQANARFQARACGNLFRCLLSKVDSEVGVFRWIEAAIELEQVEMLPVILDHAASKKLAFWQCLSEANLLHDFLYQCIQRPWHLIRPVLDTVPRALWPTIGLLITEEGDTCLHVAVQRHPSIFYFLLEAIQPDAQMLAQQNIADHTVIEEALAHGALHAVYKLYSLLAPPAQQAFESAAGPLIAQALVRKPASTRVAFLEQLVEDLPFVNDPIAWQSAALHEIARLGDQHALFAAVVSWPDAAGAAPTGQTNLLHVVAQCLPGSIRGLQTRLTTKVLSILAAARDQADMYPEDYTDSAGKKHKLQDLRKNAASIAPVGEEASYVAELTQLLGKISDTADIDSREAAADLFVIRAAELTALTAEADQLELQRYLGVCGWQVLRALDRPDGPGIGPHFFVHDFTTTLDSLKRRARSFKHVGGTRFGEHDSVALLRLRRQALCWAAEQARPSSGKVSTVLTDPTLRGDGILRLSSGTDPVYCANLTYVNFVMCLYSSGRVCMLTMYPVSNQDLLKIDPGY